MINIVRDLIKQKQEELFKAENEKIDLENKMSDPSTLKKNAVLIKDTEDIIDMLENFKDCTEGKQTNDIEKSVDLYQEHLRDTLTTTRRRSVDGKGLLYELGLWTKFRADIFKQYKDLETKVERQNIEDTIHSITHSSDDSDLF